MWPFNRKSPPDLSAEIEAAAQRIAASQPQTNAASAVEIRRQLATVISGNYDGADTLHHIYQDFGYPNVLQFHHFWNMYRRFGFAKNIVDLPCNITWLDVPKVVAPDRFQRELKDLIDRCKFWHRMRGLDNRQRVGRYAGLFMRVRDGKQPHEPLEGTLPGSRALVQMVPIYEGNLRVDSIQTDPRSDDYGLPTMYQFISTGAGNRNENQAQSFQIHPSRIVISAEGADNGDIYGVPALEAPYNSLMDLRKIIGAGGEGFYKNAAQNIVFGLKDLVNAANNEKLIEAFTEKMEEFQQQRMQKSLFAPGMDVNALSSTLTNPKEYAQNAINDLAAASGIPATILMGAQTGRLASDEDSRHFLSVLNSRRENHATEQTTSVIEWCIRHGVLPADEYEFEWSDLLALSDEERLANAVKMGEVNAKHFVSTSQTVFTGAEIREAAGFEDFDELPELDDDDADQKPKAPPEEIEE